MYLLWEDQTAGGDRDFDDAGIRALFSAPPQFVGPAFGAQPVEAFVPGSPEDEVFQVPTGLSPTARAVFKLEASGGRNKDEIGVFRVSDATGRSRIARRRGTG